MDPPVKPISMSVFQVYLRLRPPPVAAALQPAQQSFYPQLNLAERFLTVEPPEENSRDGSRTHITLQPPSDSRKRAVEKFAFTKVFEEDTSQLDIFKGAGVIPLVEGVLGESRDGLLATLGVTGSGKVSKCPWKYYAKLIKHLEPYDSRIEVATRPNTTITRSIIPIARSTNSTSKHKSLSYIDLGCS